MTASNPYDRIASDWDAARVTLRPGEERYVQLLLDELPANSRLLDLGCGAGRPIATSLVAAGHRVVGVDASASLLEIARERLPEQRWIQADVREFDTQERFAVVVCWDSVFFHLERAEHQGMLDRIRDWLEPGGRLLLTAGGSDHPAFTDTMFGVEFFYDSHPPETLRSLVEDAGYRIRASELLERPDGGRNKGRLILLAERDD